MKKILVIIGCLLLLMVGLSEAVLPKLGAKALEHELQQALKTDAVTVSARTFPACRLLVGHIGDIDIEAEHGMLGNLPTEKLSLHGERVQMPPDVLLNNNFAITDADVLTLAGTVTE